MSSVPRSPVAETTQTSPAAVSNLVEPIEAIVGRSD
jgi:hypothetical protein